MGRRWGGLILSERCPSSEVCEFVGLEWYAVRCCLFSASFDQGVVREKQVIQYGIIFIWGPDDLGLILVDRDFFASFGASQRLGASEELFSLGRGREGFLSPTAPFELSGVGLLGESGRLAASWSREICVGAVGQGWNCGEGFDGYGEAWGFP